MQKREGHAEAVDRVAAVCYRQAGESVQFKLVRTNGGRWTFPKGRVEKGETPWRAAQREAMEETGVSGRIESERFAMYLREKRGRDGRYVKLTVDAYLLRVESESGTAEPGRDPTWFSPEEAKQRLAENQRPRYQQACGPVIDEACRRLAQQDAGRV